MRKINKSRLRLTGWLVFLAVCLVGGLFGYASIVKRNFQKEVRQSLWEVGQQTVTVLKKEIDGKISLVSGIGDTLEAAVTGRIADDLESAVVQLQKMAEQFGFKRLGIALKDGTAYSSDGLKMDLSNRAYFAAALEGKTGISDALDDYTDGKKINVYSSPVYLNGELDVVFFATYDTKHFSETLSSTTFGGTGYCYVVKQNGELVASPFQAEIRGAGQDIFGKMEEGMSKSELQDLKLSMEKQETGIISYAGKIPKYISYIPTGVNDWYLFNVVPQSVVGEKLDDMMGITYLLCTFLILLFFSFFIYSLNQEKRRHRELERVALRDPLTGGWTYGRFLIEAPKALRQSNDKKAALVTMDINQFKLINDLFGYEKGNQAIRFLHKLWSELLAAPECWAHLHADDFSALLFYRDREELEERICWLFKKMREMENLPFKLSPAFGIYEIADRKLEVSAMYDCSLIAKSQVKGRQDKYLQYFDASLREKMLYKKELEDELEEALASEAFQVVYQPKYNGYTGRIVGAEALVRWEKSDGTVLNPGEFISVFEEDGLIMKLDTYMFRAVCRQQEEWEKRMGRVVPISVNLSKQHLYKTDFLEEYQEIISRCRIPQNSVELEITEGTMAQQKEQMQQMIQELHRMGIRILMDDFGTGYASFSMLKSLEIDILKLDKSLIDDIGNQKGEKVLGAIIRMAQSLGIELIAEGVERETQLNFLLDSGCGIVQGYYFSKPLSGEEFEKLLVSS